MMSSDFASHVPPVPRYELYAEGEAPHWTGTLEEFLADNDGLTFYERRKLRTLGLGARMLFGGGAGMAFFLRRVS